jgi:hypothetical protein
MEYTAKPLFFKLFNDSFVKADLWSLNRARRRRRMKGGSLFPLAVSI